MDFYLGNNNEVKFGRFPIPERPRPRRARRSRSGPFGERSQLKCLSHFVAYKLLLLSPRRLGYPPASPPHCTAAAAGGLLRYRGCYHVQPIEAINVFLILTIHYVENDGRTRTDTERCGLP